MEGHEKSALKDVVTCQKKTEQLDKLSTSCLDDHNFKKEMETVVESFQSMLAECLEMLVFGTSWWS